MSQTQTVDLIGEGTDEDPYRPDYDGDYDNASYDFEDGTVRIDVRD
jgi:hypothetical protein